MDCSCISSFYCNKNIGSLRKGSPWSPISWGTFRCSLINLAICFSNVFIISYSFLSINYTISYFNAATLTSHPSVVSTSSLNAVIAAVYFSNSSYIAAYSFITSISEFDTSFKLDFYRYSNYETYRVISLLLSLMSFLTLVSMTLFCSWNSSSSPVYALSNPKIIFKRSS